MALFLIEREFAEAIGMTQEGIDAQEADNDERDFTWLFSFLSADKRKSYCLYEAPSAEALRQQADDLGIPANVIVEVSEINPKLFAEAGSVTGHPVNG